MAQELVALADDFTEAVQHLGEVAAGGALDRNRRAEEPYVLGRHTLLQPRERLADIAPQPELLGDPRELRTDGIRHLFPDQPDAAPERVARADGPRHHVHRVRKITLEAIETPVRPVAEVHDWK